MMKINIQDAIREYDAEQARLAEEMMENSMTATVETDPLWDCWYYFADTYEPETGKYDEPECYDDVEDDASTEQVCKPVNNTGKNRAKRAERRKATAMHKRKVRRNVSAIWWNYGERETEDMYNWSYKKLKDGDRIIRPKSQSKKADIVLKKAMKANLLPEELRDDIVKHLKWVSEYCKRNIGGQLYVDQINRGREEAIKRELDEMAKAGINIFEPISRYQIKNGQWLLKKEAA